MKIALVTYHYSNNHGAVMQSYALCRFLREEGHNVELIDIRQTEGTNLNVFGRLIKKLLVDYRIRRNQKLFFPPLSKRYMSVDELRADPPIADIFMVGSDQVWNPNISGEMRMAYFLDFGKEETKRVSYASSFGLADWPLKDENTIQGISTCLRRFNAISVREKEGQAICKNVFGVNADVVLDPTFLNESYPEFVKKTKQQNLLVCYKINKTDDFWQYTPQLANYLGMPVTILNYNYPKKGYRYCFPPSVNTWMKKMASAGFILTDSFHGIAFSLINKKQFIAILNHNGRDSRLINLISSLGLEDRMFDSVSEALKAEPWKKAIDYHKMRPKIDGLREHSVLFLRNALK